MSQQQLNLSSTTNIEVEVVDNSPPMTLPCFNDYHQIDDKVLENIVYEALVFATLNGLLVGDKSVEVIPLLLFYFIFTYNCMCCYLPHFLNSSKRYTF